MFQRWVTCFYRQTKPGTICKSCWLWIKGMAHHWYFVTYNFEHVHVHVHVHVRSFLPTSFQVIHVGQNQKVSGFCSLRALPQSQASAFLVCFFVVSYCSQNCWIDWNSAVLCMYFFKCWHMGVWTFARFVRPLLATILFAYHGKSGHVFKKNWFFLNITQKII